MSHRVTERRFRILASAAIAVAGVYALPSMIKADPFYNLKLRASASSGNALALGGGFQSSLLVTVGQTVFYQLIGNMSPAGTVNNTFLGLQYPGPNTLVEQ